MSQTFEGFDFQRAQDPNRSAKDAFADLSRRAPVAPTHDKNALGQWFQQHIRPGMQSLGHNVTDAGGDGFRFNNWQGDFWVDFGRGAGAPGGALAWQADPADDATKQRYGTGGGAQRQGAPIGRAMPGQQSDLMAQILESLNQQQTTPQELLLQQFR